MFSVHFSKGVTEAEVTVVRAPSARPAPDSGLHAALVHSSVSLVVLERKRFPVSLGTFLPPPVFKFLLLPESRVSSLFLAYACFHGELSLLAS